MCSEIWHGFVRRDSPEKLYRTYGHVRLLRSLDMPLDGIRAFLSTPDLEAVRAHLARRRERIEDHIARSQCALSLLRALEDQ